jgi:hypothetical protein
MSNPLIDKYEELYGKPKVETTEETTEETPKKEYSLVDTIDTTSLSVSSLHNLQTLAIAAPSNNYISVSQTPNNFYFPCTTELEKNFCKVLESVANKKATVSSIRADVDTSFSGFGGQIRYTIEIIGTYP